MNYLIGIEREGFRIDFDGKMANTLHPQEFGEKLENPLIGTDFGEAMLELRTHPQQTPETCYKELREITALALEVLYKKGELLWPYSVPYKTPEEADFFYNKYPGRPDMEEHERVITKVYGIKRNCLSGIHVNFSISNEMLGKIRQIYPNVPDDKDEAYLKCAKNILAHEKALRYFFDASPTDFEGKIVEENSLRNGPAGFRNENAKKLDYSSKKAYIQSLKHTLSYERLSAIRLKSIDKENFDEGIAEHGIERLEFRLCDIDPFDVCGISLNEITLATAMIFMCIVIDKIPRNPKDILSKCAEVNRKLDLGFDNEIKYYIEQENKGVTKSETVRSFIKKKGYNGFIELAIQYGKNTIIKTAINY